MAELDISANSIQLDCSVDSGICVEGATKDLKKKLQEFKRILFILERDKEAMRLLRERLSRIAERKIVKKKKDGQAVCNVCFTPIDTDDSKTCIACCSCAKNVCRDEKCSEWVPKEGEWRCQLCAARRDSYGKASTWVEEQYSVKGVTSPLFSCPMRARSEIYIPLCDPNESAFLCNFESVSEAPSPINTNQKQHIREYIEEVLAGMIGGSLDTATVASLSTDENYQQVRNGHELQGVSNVRLRRLIESVIAETIRQPPFSSSGLTTTTAIDSSDIDHREALPLNGNHCNGNGGQYFESKKYQDLLATAVLNRIVSTHGNGRHSESSPDLTSSSVLDNNHNALNLSKTDESASSSSSVEPRSESSLTDPIRSINKDNELSPIGDYRNFYDDAANDNVEADRESVLSDFIASHMVPLPHISNDPASEEEEEDEEDFISVASSRDAAWEDNWLFKKKKSSKTSSSVGMLVPAPKEDIRALIGDKPTDEVSDLSEAGSDTDDSLEMVSASLEPLNDRLVNQHLIGGKNTKIVLDELVEQTSMISTSSLPENVPPYTETKNEFVVSNDGLNESEPLKIPVNSCNKAISNEAINSDVTKCVSTKAEKLGKETHQVIEDESIVPPPNDFTDDEKMRNLLAKFNEEQNNKTDSGDDNSSSLSPRSSISCALSAGIDRAELDAYEGITDFCVEDEESLASEIDMSMAESSSRRPSVIEILAAIALGPMLAVSASDDRNILTELEVKSLMELNELAMAELNAKNAEERRLGVIVEESFDSCSVDENRMEAVGISEETDLLSSPKMVMDAIRELVGKEPKLSDANDTKDCEEEPEELAGTDKTIKESIEPTVCNQSYVGPEQGKENSSDIEKEINQAKSVEALNEDAIKPAESQNEKQLETEDPVKVNLDEILDESILQSQDTFEDLHIESFATLNEDPVMSEEAKDVILPEQFEVKQNTEVNTQAFEGAIDKEVLGNESETKPNSSVTLNQHFETNSILEDLASENIIPEVTSSISSESLHTIGSSPEMSDDMEIDTITKSENISSLAELSDRKLQEIKESKPKSEDTNTNNEFILPPPMAFCDEALKSLKESNKGETVQVTEAHIISETVQAKSELTSDKNNYGIESKADEQNIKTHNEDLLTDSINRTEGIQREKSSLEEDITKACEVTSLHKEIVCQEECEEPPDKQPKKELPTELVADSNFNQSEKPTIEKTVQAEETSVQITDPESTEQNDVSDKNIEESSHQEGTKGETDVEIQTISPKEPELVEDDKLSKSDIVTSSEQQSTDSISDSQAVETQSAKQQTESEKEPTPEKEPNPETTEELNIENSQSMPLAEEVKTNLIDEQQKCEDPSIAQQCEQLIHETKSSETVGALQATVKIEGNEKVAENEKSNSSTESQLQTTEENENISLSIEEATKSEELLTKNITESPSNTEPLIEQQFENLELEDLQQINNITEDSSNEGPYINLEEVSPSEAVETETLSHGEIIAESVNGELLEPNDAQNKEKLENEILVDNTVICEELQPIEQSSSKLQTEALPFENISQSIANIDDRTEKVTPGKIEVSSLENIADVKINEDIIDETSNSKRSTEEIPLSTEVSADPPPETQLTEEVQSKAIEKTQTIEEDNEIQNKEQEKIEDSKDILEVNTTAESEMQASEETAKGTSPKTEDLTPDLIPSEKVQQDALETAVEEEIKTLEIESLLKDELLESTNTNIRPCDEQTLAKESEHLNQAVTKLMIGVALEVGVKIEEGPEEQISKPSGSNEPPTADIASVVPFFKTDIVEEANETEEKQIAVAVPTILKTETANEVSKNETEETAISETTKAEREILAETSEIPAESPNLDETATEKICEAQKNITFDANLAAEPSSAELQTEESSEDLKPEQKNFGELNTMPCTEETLKIVDVTEEIQIKIQTEEASNESQVVEVILPEDTNDANIISNSESSALNQTQEDISVETSVSVTDTDTDADQIIEATLDEGNVKLLEPPNTNESETNNISVVPIVVGNNTIEPNPCTGNIAVEKISDELQKDSTPELISESGTAPKSVIFDQAAIISLAENTSNVTVTEIVSNACMIGDNSVQVSIGIPKEEIETVQQQAGNSDSVQFPETIKLENISARQQDTENLVSQGLAEPTLAQTEKPLDGLEFKSRTENEEDASRNEFLQESCELPANEKTGTVMAVELIDDSKIESINVEEIHFEQENIDLTELKNTVGKESKVQEHTNLDTSNLEEAEGNIQSQIKTIFAEEETAKTTLGEQNVIEQDIKEDLKPIESTVIDSNSLVKDIDIETVCKEEVSVAATTSADTEVNQNICLDQVGQGIDVGSEKNKSYVEATVDDTQVEEKSTEQPAEVDVGISTSTTNVTTDEAVITCEDETISPLEILINPTLTEDIANEATAVEQSPNYEKADSGSESLTEQPVGVEKPCEILPVGETAKPEILSNEMKIEEKLPEIEAKDQGTETDISTQSKDFVQPAEVVQAQTVEVEIKESKQNTESDTVKQERTEEVSEIRDTEPIEETTKTIEAISINTEQENKSSETPAAENIVPDACTLMKTDEPVVEETIKTQTTPILHLIETVEKHSAEDVPIDEIQVLSVNPDNLVKSSPTAETLNGQISESSIKTAPEDSKQSESINTEKENVEGTTEKVHNEIKSQFEDMQAEDSKSNNQNILSQDTQMTSEIEVNMDKTLTEALENSTPCEDRTDLPKEAIAALPTSVGNEEKIVEETIQVTKSQAPTAEEPMKTSTDEVNLVEISDASIPENKSQNEDETTKESQVLLTATSDSALKADDGMSEEVPEAEANKIPEFSEMKAVKSTNDTEKDTFPEQIQKEDIGMALKSQPKIVRAEKIIEELKPSDQIMLQKSEDEDKKDKICSESLEKEAALIDTTIQSESRKVDEEISALITKKIVEETSIEDLPIDKAILDKENTELLKSQDPIPEEAIKISKDEVRSVEDSLAGLHEIKPTADNETIKDTPIPETEAQNESEPVIEIQAPIIDDIDRALESQNEQIEQSLKNEEKRVEKDAEQVSEQPISSDLDSVEVTKESEIQIKIENIDGDVESPTKVIPVEKNPENQVIISSTIAPGTQKSDDEERKEEIFQKELEKATFLLETMPSSESPSSAENAEKISSADECNEKTVLDGEISELSKSQEKEMKSSGNENLSAEQTLDDLNSIPENESLKDSKVQAGEVQIEDSLTQSLKSLTAGVDSLSQPKDEQTEKIPKDETKDVEDTTKTPAENSETIESANTEVENIQCTKEGKEDNVPDKIQNQIDEEQSAIEVVSAKEIAEELESNNQDVIPVNISQDTQKSDEIDIRETSEKTSLPTESLKVDEEITALPSNVPSEEVSIGNTPLVEELSEVSKPQEPILEEALLKSADKICDVEYISTETISDNSKTDNEIIKDDPIPGKEVEKDEEPVKEIQSPLIDTTASRQRDQATEKDEVLEEPIQAPAEILEPIKSTDTKKDTVGDTKEQVKDIIYEKANSTFEGVLESQSEDVFVEENHEAIESNNEDIISIAISQGTHESDKIKNIDKNCTEISQETPMSSDPSSEHVESALTTNVENTAEISRELVSIDKTALVEEISESQEPIKEEAMLPTDHVCEAKDFTAETALDSKIDNETKVSECEDSILENEVELLTGAKVVVGLTLEDLKSKADNDIIRDAPILEREIQIKDESQEPLNGAPNLNDEQIEKVPEDEAIEIDDKSEQTSEPSKKTSTEIPEIIESKNTEEENIQCIKDRDEDTVPECIQSENTDGDLKPQTGNNVEEIKAKDQDVLSSTVPQEILDGDITTLTSNVKNAEEIPGEKTSIERTTPVDESAELSKSEEPTPEVAVKISADEVCGVKVLASEKIPGELKFEVNNESIPNVSTTEEEDKTKISAEASLQQTSDTCVSLSKINDEIEATLIEQPTSQGLENLHSQSEVVSTFGHEEDQQLENLIVENTLVALESDPAINDQIKELQSTSQDASKVHEDECISEKEDPTVDTKTTSEIPKALDFPKPPEVDSVEAKLLSVISSEDVTNPSEENPPETAVAIETVPDEKCIRESISQNPSNREEIEVITVLEQTAETSNSCDKSEIESVPIVVPPDLSTTASSEEVSSETVKVLHTGEIPDVSQQNDVLLSTDVAKEEETITIELEASSQAVDVLQGEEASVNTEMVPEEPKPQDEEVTVSSESVGELRHSDEPGSGQQEIHDHLPEIKPLVVSQEEEHSKKVSDSEAKQEEVKVNAALTLESTEESKPQAESCSEDTPKQEESLSIIAEVNLSTENKPIPVEEIIKTELSDEKNVDKLDSQEISKNCLNDSESEELVLIGEKTDSLIPEESVEASEAVLAPKLQTEKVPAAEKSQPELQNSSTGKLKEDIKKDRSCVVKTVSIEEIAKEEKSLEESTVTGKEIEAGKEVQVEETSAIKEAFVEVKELEVNVQNQIKGPDIEDSIQHSVSQDAFKNVDDLKTEEASDDVISKPAEVAQLEEAALTKAKEKEESIEASKPLESISDDIDSKTEIEQTQNKESVNELLTSTESSKENTKIDLEENIQLKEPNYIEAERNEKEVEAQEIIDLAVDSLQLLGPSTSLKTALTTTEKEHQTENSSDIEPTQIKELITQKQISSLECPPVSSEEDQITNEVLAKKVKEDILTEVLTKKIAEELYSNAQEAQEFAKEIKEVEDSNNETQPTDKITEVSRSQDQMSDLEEKPKSFVNEEGFKIINEASQNKVPEGISDAEEIYIPERSESNVNELVQKEKCQSSEITDAGEIAMISSEEIISASKHAPMQSEEIPFEEASSKPENPVVSNPTCQKMLSEDVSDPTSLAPSTDVTTANQNKVPLSPEEISVSESTPSQETSKANTDIPEEILEVTDKSTEGELIPKPLNASVLTAPEEIGLFLAVASCENVSEPFTEMIAEVSEIPSTEALAVSCNIINHPPLQPTESLSDSAQYPTEDYDKISHPILETYSDKSVPSLAEELKMAAIRNDTQEPKSECVVPQMISCTNRCLTADPQTTKPTASDSVATDQPNAQDASQGNHISQATRQHLFAEQSSKKSKIKHSGSKFWNLTLRDRRFLAELEKRRKQRELIQNYLDTLDCIDTPSYLSEDLYLFESKCSIDSSPYSLFIEPSDYCIVAASRTSPNAKSHFLNNILFSDRISSESNCTDDSTTTVIDTFGSMGSGSNSDSCEDFSPDDSTDRESSATATTANNSTINTNNVTNQSHIYSPPPPPIPQSELRTESACSKLLVSRTTGGNEEHVDDDPLKHLVPGSIAEREYKKWYNAVDMPNNPYSVEALRRRLSGGPDRVLDLPNISPCIEDNPLQLGESPSAEAEDKSQERDYARYSRDYYINDAKHASGTTKKSPTSPPQISSPTPTASSIELQEQAESTAEPVEKTPVKEMCHKLEKQCRIDADLYLATPVQVIEDIPLAFAEKNAAQAVETITSLTTEAVSKVSSETSSLLTYESLTPSEDSDTIRIYDLKKQETRLVKEPTHTTTITVPKSPEKKVRPTELNITPTLSPPIATVSSKSSTPTSFKFLQPKRKLIDPSQVLSIDLDTTPITPSTSEKPVIEAEVAHAMPSVKALAKAFLMTSTTCSSSDNKWRKARAKSPLHLFKPTTPAPTPAANANKIVQNQPEPVIADTTSQGSEDATIASDLSSLETDPPSRIDSDTMDTIALARQSSQERALSPVLVSGCLRNNIAFFENLKNK